MENKLFNIWFFSKDDNIIDKIEYCGTLNSARVIAEQKINSEKDVYADYEIVTLSPINH